MLTVLPPQPPLTKGGQKIQPPLTKGGQKIQPPLTKGGATGGSEPEEGAFYVWTYSELEQLLNAEELVEIHKQFTVSRGGNFEGKNVLQRRHAGQLSETVETALAKLFQFRYGGQPETVKTFPQK